MMRKNEPITFSEYMRLQARIIRRLARIHGISEIQVVEEYSATFRAIILKKHGQILQSSVR